MGYKYKNINNIPYGYFNKRKHDSLGKTMTIRQALDLWWNSVRIRLIGDLTYFVCYKCSDYTYELDGLDEELGLTEKKLLRKKIELEDCWEVDSDGYPIVFAKLLEE